MMPSTQTSIRRSSAIMFTDIEGYTSLTSKDELAAFNLVKKKISILKPLVNEWEGWYVKEIGDGTLSCFKNPSDASECALQFQLNANDDDQLNVRVGIHFGDAIYTDKDVFGDVVNVAARIESRGIPGGIVMSKVAYEQIPENKRMETISLGLQAMKGVGRLIELLAIVHESLAKPNLEKYIPSQISFHKDPDIPSIAVVPFLNKGKEEDIFFAYGIGSDLIADVSGAGSLRIISMHDIENIDYANLSSSDIAENLKVRYVVTGSLLKIGKSFQLSMEVFDGKKSTVLWSDLWQENWDSLPSIKGKLADGILKLLNKTPNPEARITNTVSNTTEAYEFYL
ncbi:uncharacterized protein METZ01_LOCUS260253 [marine metagenome]|uniref:Guanylate cyclase domain-containing protein n=1 Tax=marine metagenome TaxID=408172 RepID=A0A382J706_9ZZZZ